MNLNFVKLQAAGNDFIVIDNRTRSLKKVSRLVQTLCTPKTGIGADGVLLVEPPVSKGTDFTIRIFNPDGSEPAMCGNGARCIAYFAYLTGIVGPVMKFNTGAGIISAEIKTSDVTSPFQGRKKCGAKGPLLHSIGIVQVGLTLPHSLQLDVPIVVDKKKIIVSSINTGVPHLVCFVKDIKKINVDTLGKKLRYHPAFTPAGTNVNFVQLLNQRSIAIRTYERGVEAETLACGTGSTASAIVSLVKGLVRSPVYVKTQSGEILTVSARINQDKGKYSITDVTLTGKVTLVFSGTINLLKI